MANNTANVTVGKPKIGGAIFNAPAGTTLPTTADGSLNAGFACLGYVSEDGLTNSNSPESDTIKAWGGDTVITLQTEKEDTFTFTLLEVLDTNVLKAVYGTDNVSGAIATGITVRANSKEVEASAWVFDMIMTGGVMKRIVVPNAKITEIGEIVYKDDEAVGYEVTLTAMPGGDAFNNDTHKEYILKSSSSSGTSGNS